MIKSLITTCQIHPANKNWKYGLANQYSSALQWQTGHAYIVNISLKKKSIASVHEKKKALKYYIYHRGKNTSMKEIIKATSKYYKSTHSQFYPIHYDEQSTKLV